ncbi:MULTISPECIES: hypothetical protein [Marinobacter]|jgi:hypothetical protein|uniref:Uncharacterized protein n=3 Tax=Marinobacter nauticus TaxID=2743 RepID=A1U5R7_MARN8|nr:MULTISPECIES: hypothetical protein [Marinobacter]ABM20336.1 hypothetical protein Maqu_3265 [Marinobacter nauticus VT8]AMQ88766.1 hypothetical protein ASQ50_08690 [Marinobacter sp. LQ44]RCW60979.1 hypothetical protein DET61_1483 [Marinobacter nauticus]
MNPREDHYRALLAFHRSTFVGPWIRPHIELEDSQCSLSVRLNAFSCSPLGTVKESIIFQLLYDASFLAAGTLETTLLVQCDKFEFFPFQNLTESRVTAQARLVYSSLKQWTIESALKDEWQNDIAWGRGQFSRSSVLLETIGPYNNELLKQKQDW